MTTEETVFVLDDEEEVRASLRMLIRSFGHNAEVFASASAFLERYRPERAGCLILDVRMPEMNGLELQEELARRDLALPIVFISGHADVPMAVRAVQVGAVDFLEKPFVDEALYTCIEKALEVDRARRASSVRRAELEARLASLTEREREVMQVLLEGAPNKIVARRLGLSVRTVEIHRARVLAKIGVDNVQQLTRAVFSDQKERLMHSGAGEPH